LGFCFPDTGDNLLVQVILKVSHDIFQVKDFSFGFFFIIIPVVDLLGNQDAYHDQDYFANCIDEVFA
jgi:hypothetical protein